MMLQFVVKDEGGGKRSLAGVKWQFNAWGGLEGGLYDNWDNDQKVAGHILEVRGTNGQSRRLSCSMLGSNCF